MNAIPTDFTPGTQAAKSLEQRFRCLAETWHDAVAHHSSPTMREIHPAYQEILRMGAAVVPLMLRELEVSRRDWFAALRALTSANPVSEKDAGRVEEMRAAWLRWGKEHGYQW